jgi:invasion protein IalB
MMSEISIRRRLAILGLMLAGATPGLAPAVLAQDPPPSAWRVECTGDGKSLDCRAIQQMINREDKQLVAQLAARALPDKSAVLLSRSSSRSTTGRPSAFRCRPAPTWDAS